MKAIAHILEVKEREMTFYVRPWAAAEALEWQAKLFKVMGENILPFIGGDICYKEAFLLHARTQADTNSIMMDVVQSCVSVDGNDLKSMITFSEVFKGNTMLFYRVFGLVCQDNFKDFLEEGRRLEKELIKKSSVEVS